MKIRHICFFAIFVLIVYIVSFAGKCAYSALPISGAAVDNPLPANPRIFVSTISYPGNLGGITGADAKCNGDTNKPTARTYKAMLMASTRNLSTDWVLKPNTTYYQSNGITPISSTDATGAFNFVSILNPIRATSGGAWTGMTTTWSLYSGYNCSDWTSTVGSGVFGTVNANTSAMLYATTLSCNIPYLLYCVEQ